MLNKKSLISGIIFLFLVAVMLISRITIHKFKVPEVTGLTLRQSQQVLEENSFPADKVLYSYAYSDSAAADTVIHQMPSPGGTVSGYNHLVLTISLGEDPNTRTELTDFQNMNQAQIEHWLDENGFTNYKFEQVKNDDVQEGLFLSCDPPAGTKLKSDQEINISIAVPSPFAVLPDFTGKKTQDIEEWAEKYDIEVIFYYYFDSSEPNTFLFADVEPGTELERGSSLGIAVSNGPQQ